MKLIVTQENLARALNTVGRVASSRTSLPILNNILLRTENNQLILAATNLEIAITEAIHAKIERDGAITIPARLMTEFVANLPKTNIAIEVDGTKVQVSAGNYQSTINAVIADEFPALPTIEASKRLSIPSETLKKAVAGTAPVSSNDTTRPILTGVYFHGFEGDLYMTATDGYRLAEAKVMPIKDELSAIIPSSTLADVVRVISDETPSVDIKLNDDQISFEIGQTTVTSRLIDGNFIDYRGLIPKKSETTALLDKAEFLRVTKIAELFARESAGSVIVKADAAASALTLHSVASQLGENNSEAEAKVSGGGSITLNSRYLLDGLNAIDADKINFQFSGKLAPTMLTAADVADYKHIIMPVKS
jgi:DNA polymerase-3 subunit beta